MADRNHTIWDSLAALVRKHGEALAHDLELEACRRGLHSYDDTNRCQFCKTKNQHYDLPEHLRPLASQGCSRADGQCS